MKFGFWNWAEMVSEQRGAIKGIMALLWQISSCHKSNCSAMGEVTNGAYHTSALPLDCRTTPNRSETKNSHSRFRYGFIIYLLLARQLSLFICLANEALHLLSLSGLNF